MSYLMNSVFILPIVLPDCIVEMEIIRSSRCIYHR